MKSRISNPKSAISNLKSELSNPKSELSNFKSEISNPKSGLSNLKFSISNPRSELSNLKSSISNPVAPLPKAWRWVRLGEVCSFIRGVTFTKAEASYSPLKGHVPILRAGNIGTSLDLDNDLVWVPAGKVSMEQRLRIGDVAICMSSGSPAVVGKTAVLEREWSGSVGAFCGILRPSTSELANYLALWFRSSAFTAWRDTQARGANIQNLRFSQFEDLEIPFPPLSEQKRIAAILKEQLATVDKARAAAEEELATINTLPAALLCRAFKGEL